MVFLSTAYIVAYFILTCFLTLVLSGASTLTYSCTKHIVMWFEVSAGFYLASFILCMVIFMIIRKQGLQSELVNMGWVEWLFFVYRPNWPYYILVTIDLIHLGLTIWGTIEFFTDLIGLINCYIELPILSNFMFIVVIIGYIYVIRMLVTIFHFKFGIRILRYIRANCRYFRRYD